MHSQFYRLAELKRDLRRRLRDAQVSPRAMTALYTGLLLVLDLVILLGSGYGVLSMFIRILCWLISMVLGAGFVLYCMAIRQGERSEYLTLFDGFSFAGRLIALNLLISLLIVLWSMLFVILALSPHTATASPFITCWKTPISVFWRPSPSAASRPRAASGSCFVWT